MRNVQTNQIPDNNIAQLSLPDLRQKWLEYWKVAPHSRIGRTMLEKSLIYKIREHESGGLPSDTRAQLDQLIKTYKRNSKCFDENRPEIKPGTRLIRIHNGTRHNVLVQAKGYEYKGITYNSLSNIATEIAGTRRNGWEFFGLKRKGEKE